jgi:hypothetical protein
MMRSNEIGCGIALWLAASLCAQAETKPYPAKITVPDVQARSGPSDKFYPTSVLHQGEEVTVVREENGWLAIEPPRGSFSWVNTRFLKQTTPQQSVVLGDDVPVRIGSSIHNELPTVEQVKLKRGTQVWLLDVRGATTPEGNWLPIAPPAQEFRYIPATAVKSAAQVQVVQSSPNRVSPVPASTAGAPPASDPLLAQAEAAERRGDYAEAVRLYEQLSVQCRDRDHALFLQCLNRIHHIQSGHRGSVPSGYVPGTPNTASYPGRGGDTRLIPSPAAGSVPYATSQYTYYRDQGARPMYQPQMTSYSPRLASPQPVIQSSGPAWLRRTSFALDNKVAYAVEDDHGNLLMYVTAQSGVDLEPFRGRHVELWGPIYYHGLMKKNYMMVAQVRELR